MKSLMLLLLSLTLVFDAVSSRAQNRVRFQNASFEEKNRRYPAPYDMFNHLKRIIPQLDYTRVPQECWSLTESNAAVLGSTIPSYGQPLETEPGALFVQLYSKCLRETIRIGISDDSTQRDSNLNALLGAELVSAMAQLANQGRTDPRPAGEVLPHFPWSAYSPEVQQRILSRLVLYLIGPIAILKRYKYIGPNNAFGLKLETAQDLTDHLNRVTTGENPTRASASLLKVIQSVTVILRLGPILLN